MLDRFKTWLYEWKNGHPFLLSEEADIICDTRSDKKYKWMYDDEIQEFIKIRIKAMYKEKYPNAKQWSLAYFKKK
jgi:hypothetical protein